MAKVLSMEIGYSLIKIIETDFKAKNPKIYRCVDLKTPDGILNDGELKVTDELVTLISGALKANKLATKQVIFSITSSKIANREVVLPGGIKENKISTVVRANASDYFPVDISRYEIAYTSLGTVGDDKKEMQRKIMVFAAPQALLEDYYNLAERCGLKLAALDYSGNSVFQVVKKECGQDIQMVIKIDERSSLVMVLDEGQLVLQRSIPYGVDEAVETFSQTYAYGELDYEQTLDVLRNKACINRTLHAQIDMAYDMDGDNGGAGEGESGRFELARQKTTDVLGSIISGIARVVDFYNSRNTGKPVRETHLTGLGGTIRGLNELLTNELGMQVSVLTKAEGFNLGKAFREIGFGGYIACLGAAVAPLGFLPSKNAEKKEKEKFTLTPLVSVSLLILCLIISVVWFVVAYLPYRQAASDNADYRAEIQSLAEQYVPDYMEYTTTKQSYEYMLGAYASTQLTTRYLVEFIDEMERKMPHAFYVSSLYVTSEGFSMSVTVSTKEEAADCIEQLRTFESIASLSVNGINDGRQVLIMDADGDGRLDMVSGGQVVGTVGANNQYLYADGNEFNYKGVTFSVEGVFSEIGIMEYTLSGEDNADNGGTQTGENGSAAQDQTAGAEEVNSDDELESAIGEINGNE